MLCTGIGFIFLWEVLPSLYYGLDPAGPIYTLIGPEFRLTATDAEFVDVIHTAGLLQGYNDPVGEVDFYPNGGTLVQPGCDLLEEVEYCSHHRSYEFFQESILDPYGFKGWECSSWINFLLGLCYNNNVAYMGAYTATNVRGLYYLSTNTEPPFAQN